MNPKGLGWPILTATAAMSYLFPTDRMLGSTDPAMSASRAELRMPLPMRSVTRIASTVDAEYALRALIEPEGPASGRRAGRLGVLGALPDQRAALTARVAHTIALERALIGVTAPGA